MFLTEIQVLVGEVEAGMHLVSMSQFDHCKRDSSKTIDKTNWQLLLTLM